MRHEEATRNYEQVEENFAGGVNVLCCFCRRIRPKARPEAAAAAEGRTAQGQG